MDSDFMKTLFALIQKLRTMFEYSKIQKKN